MHCYTFTAVFALWLATAGSEVAPPLALTSHGYVRGSWLKTYAGKPFAAFQGIKYAEAQRFQPPVPVKSWGAEVKNATADGVSCVQPFAKATGIQTSEDCLFLNVYTPQVDRGQRPVVVCFHGGAYAVLSGSSDNENPTYLMDQNKPVVLVICNFRLGALGFLSTGDDVLPGNYGMLDQQEVLKWVHQNIASFGGNPFRVTITGNSAGASSVAFHMVSPMSRGYFHGAGLMSGSPFSGWAINRKPKVLAGRVAALLGCSGTESLQIRDCFLKSSAEDIVDKTLLIKDYQPEFPLGWFAPVVDQKFLPSDPLAMFLEGNFFSVPVVIGCTQDEYAGRANDILQIRAQAEDYDSNFNTIAPIELMYRGEEMSESISAKLRQFYLQDKPISNSTKREFMELYTDALFTAMSVQFTKLLVVKSKMPVYSYIYAYKGRLSNYNNPGTNIPYGIVAHQDDFNYFLPNSKKFPLLNATDPEIEIVKILTTLWTSFATDGVPKLPDPSSQWLPVRPDQYQYMNLTANPHMTKGVPFPDRMSFWDKLFPLSGPRQEQF